MRRAVLLGTIAILAVGWMRGISAKTRPEYPCAFKTETGQLVSLRDATHARAKAVRIGETTGVRLNNVTRWNAEEVIRCVAKAYGMSPGPFLSVAECESHTTPDDNLYQYIGSTWESASETYGHAGADVSDGYANLHVTVQYVRDAGWEPWTCQP